MPDAPEMTTGHNKVASSDWFSRAEARWYKPLSWIIGTVFGLFAVVLVLAYLAQV